MAARTARTRTRWALLGLATPRELDATTQAMLLRQLFLACFEARDFSRALEVARQAIELGVLADVLHQDAARAALAAGDVNASVEHLRMAARSGPASRRGFHLWTLGSTLFLAHRYREAIAALEHALRAGKSAEPLYRAHLSLVRLAMGEAVANLEGTIEALASAPSAQGYGRFVLGHLAYASGALEQARRYLRSFVRRAEGGRGGLATVLDAELKMTRATLSKISDDMRVFPANDGAWRVRNPRRGMSALPSQAGRAGEVGYTQDVHGCGVADPKTVDTLFGRGNEGGSFGGKP